jgi:hypothetical protein
MENASLSEKLKPRKNGIVGISGEALSISYFRDTLLHLEAERRMADFIYWPTQNSIILVSSKRIGLRHDTIIQALQIDPVEAIGGRITRHQGRIVTTEWSGHYGDHRWTPAVREQCHALLTNLFNESVTHLPWNVYAKDNVHTSSASEFPMPQPAHNAFSSPAHLFSKKFKGTDLTVLSLSSDDAKSITSASITPDEESSPDWIMREPLVGRRKRKREEISLEEEEEDVEEDADEFEKNEDDWGMTGENVSEGFSQLSISK